MGTSRKRLRKCSREVHTDTAKEDGPFSWLPDEIIVSHILPRLTLQEAVRCSVLSRRWEKLWTQIIGPKLLFSRSFDHDSKKVFVDNHLMSKLAPNFANWITRVLKTYSKPTLEELIVRYGFSSRSSQSLDGWVEYALRSGVTRLELDLSPRAYRNIKQYAFPSVKVLSSIGCSGFCNLRDICLKHVDVPVKAIQFMLSKCPLERFSLWHSKVLGRIKVSKKLFKLKILEFVYCSRMVIHISAPNLVSLKYIGYSTSLKTKPLPHLLELSIGKECGSLFLRTGANNFQCISQIRRLSLIRPEESLHHETIRIPLDFPTFVNLEQLELTMSSDRENNNCLLWPIFLIKAAPHLRSISIEFVSRRMSVEQQDWSDMRNAAKLVKHPSLELIELHEYSGIPCERELGRVLLDGSPSLKKLTVWPKLCHRSDNRKPCDWWPVEKYRKRVQKLRRWIPNGVDFVVL